MDGATLLKVVSTANSLQAFLTGGDLLKALQLFGRIEFDAAIFSLKNVNWAKDSKREIQLAIGHLQSAHITFMNMYLNRNLLQRNIQYNDVRRGLSYDQQTNLLMALCYCYLDEKELMRQSLNRAIECKAIYDKYDKESDSGILFIGFINPSHYIDIVTGKDGSWPTLIGESFISSALSKMENTYGLR